MNPIELRKNLILRIAQEVNSLTDALIAEGMSDYSFGFIRVASIRSYRWDARVLARNMIFSGYTIYEIDGSSRITWVIDSESCYFSPRKSIEITQDNIDELVYTEALEILRNLGLLPSALSLLLSTEISS